MKQPHSLLFLLPFLILLFYKCANPLSPTGGPRDTIPPTLIESNPTIGQLNFDDNNLRLVFDEFISSDQLLRNLIITPNQDIKYSPFAKKNIVTLKLTTPLQDSTTYIFNFFNGITDITEKNPAENLIIPFSTGSFIDSLQLTGTVKDVWTQQVQESITVGLYLDSDTLDYTQVKPTYFVKSLENGRFSMSYLKPDNYKLFAFEDTNDNLLFEPDEEQHAFLQSTFTLSQNIDSLVLQTVLLHPYPPKILSSRPVADFFQIRYNKVLSSYTIDPQDSTLNIFSRQDEEGAIKIYSQPTYPDSLQIIVSAYDTLRNTTIDTLFVKFNESQRRKESFSAYFPTRPITATSDTLEASITFNKPITQVNIDSAFIQVDTLLRIPLSTYVPLLNWNHNRTRVNLKIPFDWQSYSDQVKSALQEATPDTTLDLTNQTITKTTLFLASQTFRSVEQDTTSSQLIDFIHKPNTNTGIIRYMLNIEHPTFIVQLINDKYETIRQQSNTAQGTFDQLPSGKYGLRILLDLDGDGRWQNNNLTQDTNHEPVYVFSEFTELRSNWDNTLGPIDTGF